MQNLRSDFIGVVLSGGKSSRFGEDKSLAKFNNTTLIEKQIKLLSRFFTKIVISANDETNYKFLNRDICKDFFPNLGPLSGIHSTLKNYNKDIFVLACDLPLVSEKLIEKILNHPSKDPVIFSTSENHVQPLCGIYKKNILPSLEKFLSGENHSVLKFLQNIKHTIIANETDLDELANMNSKEDYLKFKERI